MGKHKIVKSAAAVALVASAVTAVAPGASAASYKVNAKDQLVSSSTGKLIKGWKVFGGKLYKNGKLAPAKKYKIIGKGAAQRLYYGPTLKKGYKTANSKALLFKDGKLADGWKQAGKNERLYKNGKLDKGYTVYTNVEGDKFLYLNGKLKKGDKTATRAGETLLFTDGLLSKGLKEFKGKTYYNGKVANGTIEGKEYDNGVLVTDVVSVKAINATTVEVTYKKAQADVKTADFTIEGLEVKNASVKQTDSKVVVLTTSTQEAGKEYTLKQGDSSKKFTGVSAVVPTAVTFSNPSQQAVIGNQVTVEAAVTVAEGQSKAGIPVTFNITDGTAFNTVAPQVVEAFTDENGVAKYTYTKYAEGDDSVQAYATGDASKRTQVGKVYWGKTQRLTIQEANSNNTLANGSKKVYNVTTTDVKDGDYLYVAFKENVNVTPDKVVKDVTVHDAEGAAYPYQIADGSAKQVVKVKVKDGKATFTLTGANATVTPIIFKDADGKETLQNTELQAQAPSVTFSTQATQEIKVEAKGVANAAVQEGTDLQSGLGGRDYTVTVTDTNGKLAPAGTKVYVGFKKDAAKDAEIYDYDAKTGEVVAAKTANVTDSYQTKEFTVGSNGQVTFRVAGKSAGYATPTVFIDNGEDKNDGKLTDKDLQVTAETTYFVAPKVETSKLSVDDVDKKVVAGTPAKFTYATLDQNGFLYPVAGVEVTFEVAAKFNNVVANGTTVVAGTTKTVKTVTLANGIATLEVNADNAADVTVNASATKGFANQTESISFVKSSTVIPVPAEVLSSINKAAADKDAEELEKALKNLDAYNKLTADKQEEVVNNILAEVKEKGSINSNKVQEILDAAAKTPETPTTPDTTLTLKEVAPALNATKTGSKEEVAAVLAKYPEYNKLNDTEKAAAVDALAPDAVTGTVETADVKTIIDDVVATKASTLTTLVYSPAAAEALGTQSSATQNNVTISTKDLVNSVDYNGTTFKFVPTTGTETTATLTDTKEVTVKLAQKVTNATLGTTEITATYDDVKKAIEDYSSDFEVTFDPSITDTSVVIPAAGINNIVLASGVNGTAATPANLVLTFDKNVALKAAANEVEVVLVNASGAETKVVVPKEDVAISTTTATLTLPGAIADGAYTVKSVSNLVDAATNAVIIPDGTSAISTTFTN